MHTGPKILFSIGSHFKRSVCKKLNKKYSVSQHNTMTLKLVLITFYGDKSFKNTSTELVEGCRIKSVFLRNFSL